MARVTSLVLLLSGALLLVTWLVSPASSAPPAQAPPPSAALDEIRPLLSDVNHQVDRLRDRLSAQGNYPRPSRDPFSFAEPIEMRQERIPEAVVDDRPVPPPVMWPRLVAILRGSGEAGADMRVALETSDGRVTILSPGGTTGTFTVGPIASDAFEITDAHTGQSTRLSLH